MSSLGLKAFSTHKQFRRIFRMAFIRLSRPTSQSESGCGGCHLRIRAVSEASSHHSGFNDVLIEEVRIISRNPMLERPFNPEALYNRIVHFYMDKKRCSKEQANEIAQKVIQREAQRRTCKNERCRHLSHDHIRNSETCLVADCECAEFTR